MALIHVQIKNCLGNCLYPFIYDCSPDAAPKIAGMLLELAPQEIMELMICLPAPALKLKIQECMDALEDNTDVPVLIAITVNLQGTLCTHSYLLLTMNYMFYLTLI